MKSKERMSESERERMRRKRESYERNRKREEENILRYNSCKIKLPYDILSRDVLKVRSQ